MYSTPLSVNFGVAGISENDVIFTSLVVLYSTPSGHSLAINSSNLLIIYLRSFYNTFALLYHQWFLQFLQHPLPMLFTPQKICSVFFSFYSPQTLQLKHFCGKLYIQRVLPIDGCPWFIESQKSNRSFPSPGGYFFAFIPIMYPNLTQAKP